MVRVGAADAKIAKVKTKGRVIENCIVNKLLKKEEQ